MASQRDLATQMIRQLRILDPSASAEIGTPERKILDTLAQGLADAQVDFSVLNSSFDIDSKYGTDLDKFLSIFSFGRQSGSTAVGLVEFSRVTASTNDILIPIRTSVAAPSLDGTPAAIFLTTSSVTLRAGELSVLAPVQSINVGTLNNVGANAITSFSGAPITGIVGVTNPAPTQGGLNVESDSEYKIRFKNTFFRNLAGTEDQYLALAVAGAFTNRAIVVGPISRYREYIQIPDEADNVGGNGSAGEYTSALSTIPYSQYTYDTVPTFLSNGKSGFEALFYTEGIDYTINVTATDKNRGDTYREATSGAGFDPLVDDEAEFQPNVTVLNAYTGDDADVELVRPGDVILFEHSYVSGASRNNYDRAITNCIDVYINGANATPATTVIPTPTGASVPFQDNAAHRYHYDNYRRLGEPEHRPQIGNIFSPLFWSPLESLPEELVIDNYTYELGTHYWGVVDVSDVGGTIRARTGIEWSIDAKGLDDGVQTGPVITANTATSIKVPDYTFDKNVIDLQSALEGSKQTTTDVLVHKATQRYFKFDITVMYDTGASIPATNQSINNSVQNLLTGIYFGSVVQISDILQRIHNVQGVDNVRWTYELDGSPKVVETNLYGQPILGGVIDRVQTGTASLQEIQSFYVTGEPSGGTYQIKVGDDLSLPIAYNADLSAVQSALAPLSSVITAPTGINGSATGTPNHPFKLRFVANGAQELVEIVADMTGDSSYNNDFFLRDNELATLPTVVAPGDTVPGFIIHRRAQNTW